MQTYIVCGNIDTQPTDMTHNENADTTLLTNSPPANYSSNTVHKNRAECDNMPTNSKVNSSIETSKDNKALNEEEEEYPLNAQITCQSNMFAVSYYRLPYSY